MGAATYMTAVCHHACSKRNATILDMLAFELIFFLSLNKFIVKTVYLIIMIQNLQVYIL